VYEEELAFAQELADRADEVTMSFFRGDFRVSRKADSTPVTEADLAVEALVREALSGRYPDDAVLGEEHGMEGSGSRVWVVDPIDGTKNFAGGIQVWATLIALAVDDRPVVGVASAPALGERYAAARRSGATLNGEPVAVSGVDDLGEALLVSSGMSDWLDGRWARGFRAVASRVARTRAFGDFWGHMLVARGSAGAMMEPELRIWDWAALQVVVEEAGGRITQLDGSPLADHASCLTTNGRLHDQVVRLMSAG
jgi:histidinol-phosphatase